MLIKADIVIILLYWAASGAGGADGSLPARKPNHAFFPSFPAALLHRFPTHSQRLKETESILYMGGMTVYRRMEPVGFLL